MIKKINKEVDKEVQKTIIKSIKFNKFSSEELEIILIEYSHKIKCLFKTSEIFIKKNGDLIEKAFCVSFYKDRLKPNEVEYAFTVRAKINKLYDLKKFT